MLGSQLVGAASAPEILFIVSLEEIHSAQEHLELLARGDHLVHMSLGESQVAPVAEDVEPALGPLDPVEQGLLLLQSYLPL